MKRILSFVCIALLAIACATPTSINITNINTNEVKTVTLSTPAESAIAGCPAIARIRINYPAILSIANKEGAEISATPLTADGRERNPLCDEGDGLSWVYSSAAFRVLDDSEFVTTIFAKTEGTFTLSVTVGKGKASVSIQNTK